MITKETRVIKDRPLFLSFNNSLVNYDKPFSEKQIRLDKPGAGIKKQC
jgi:hypothetical protein